MSGAAEISPVYLKIKKFFPLILITLPLLVYYAFSYESPGVTWDEPLYIERASSYNNFFSSFFNPRCDDFLKLNSVNKYLWNEYYIPYKLSFSSVFRALLLFIFSNGLFALRFSTALIFLILLFFVYKFVLNETKSVYTAALSCAFLILTPRFFAHTRFGALDIFTAAFWFISSYYFYNYLLYDRGLIKFIIIYGAALQVRAHLVFLIPVFFVTALYFRKFLNTRKTLKLIIISCLIIPVIFFVLDPWLWDSPVEKIMTKISFYTQRTDGILIYSYYFGKHYAHVPPASYVFIMVFLTTPAFILLFFFYGIYKMKNKFYMFCFINFICGLLIYSLPLPKHDGVRLFLYAFPFMAVLSAYGLAVFSSSLSLKLKINSRAVKLTVTGIALAVLIYGFLSYYPHLTSYYGEFIGGVRGAEKYGFDITYWQDSFNADAVNFLNKTLPQKARVVIWPFDARTIDYYKKNNILRRDPEFYGIYEAFEKGGSFYFFYHNRESFLTDREKEFFDYLFMNKKYTVINEIKKIPLNVYFGEVNVDSYKRSF